MGPTLLAAALVAAAPPESPQEAAPPAAESTKAPEITLTVAIVNDPELPRVTRADADVIFAEALRVMGQKLGFASIAFDFVTEMSLADFITTNVRPGDPCLEPLEPYRVSPSGRRAIDLPRAKVTEFLERWKVEELRAFFPEAERAQLTDRSVITEKLLAELDRKLGLIAETKLPSGKKLLAPETLAQRSYVHWICAMRNQSEFDFVLTNAFVLYDLGSEPYPHSVFQKNKVGGASLHSPGRAVLRERAVFGSTFSMMTDIPFFAEPGAAAMSRVERLKVIGAFIVAHKLGHALFKMPDFYDHPKECLMTTQLETDYVAGYRFIAAHPGACPKCAPWVSARRDLAAADAARKRGALAEAVKLMTRGMQGTPKHIDGNYPRYVAAIAAEIAELHYALGDKVQARRWAVAALKLVPGLVPAIVLRTKIDAEQRSASPSPKGEAAGKSAGQH